MKKLFIACLLLTSFGVQAQEKNEKYVMFEAITLSMKSGDNAKLKEVMKTHNDTYHKSDPHKAQVYAINSGPNAGKMVWMMGPLQFADLDNRPEGKAHDDDWKKVQAFIESLSSVEYWRRDDDLSVLKDKTSNQLYVRFWNVSREYGFLVNDLLKKISETQKALDRENSWTVWDNQFRQGSRGRHMATVGGFDKWADLDKDMGFKKKFEELYGEDAWIPFWRTFDLAFTDSWDEIWTYLPEMSSK